MRKRFVDGFHYDAHPMGMFVSAIAALGTFYEDAKDIFDDREPPQADPAPHRQDPDARRHVLPLLGRPALQLPRQRPVVPGQLPQHDVEGRRLRGPPALERAMDVLFILHADHEQNCGTTAMRVVGSSQADPYSACAAAPRALRPAARRRQRGRRAHAQRDRLAENVPAFIET
jgi:citrate synthase